MYYLERFQRFVLKFFSNNHKKEFDGSVICSTQMFVSLFATYNFENSSVLLDLKS